MTKQTDDATGWYGNTFKAWAEKQLGRKPTAAELNAIHALGARPGKQALAAAMALRSCGVTGGQIVIACGAPQLNKMRGFVTDGLARWVPTPPTANGHKVYRLELTAKGKAKGTVKASKPADEPKAKRAAKPKAQPAKPASEAAKPVEAQPATQA